MYIAVLDKNCDPHYFNKKENAINYLISNAGYNDIHIIYTEETANNGDIVDSNNNSLGYFYKIEPED